MNGLQDYMSSVSDTLIWIREQLNLIKAGYYSELHPDTLISLTDVFSQISCLVTSISNRIVQSVLN